MNYTSSHMLTGTIDLGKFRIVTQTLASSKT